MNSERRQNFRLLMTMECASSVDKLGFRRFKTRDISQDGAFVVGDTKGLKPNSQVTLAIEAVMDGRTQFRHLRAIVRYLTATGAGLYVEDSHKLLQSLMARRAQAGGLGALQQRASLVG